MPRDYKHRANPSRKKTRGISAWRWISVVILVGAFAAFLVSLNNPGPQSTVATKSVSVPAAAATKKTPEKKEVQSEVIEKKPGKSEPQFTFYDELTKDQVEIPASEITSIKREEKLGKAPVGVYELQAGSFREMKQATKLKIDLANNGFRSRIETATISNAVWNRVKLGPYSSMNKADSVRRELRSRNIDSVVTIRKAR